MYIHMDEAAEKNVILTFTPRGLKSVIFIYKIIQPIKIHNNILLTNHNIFLCENTFLSSLLTFPDHRLYIL